MRWWCIFFLPCNLPATALQGETEGASGACRGVPLTLPSGMYALFLHHNKDAGSRKMHFFAAEPKGKAVFMRSVAVKLTDVARGLAREPSCRCSMPTPDQAQAGPRRFCREHCRVHVHVHAPRSVNYPMFITLLAGWPTREEVEDKES